MADVYLRSQLHCNKLDKLLNLAGESHDQRNYRKLQTGYFHFKAAHTDQLDLDLMVSENGLAMNEKHTQRAIGNGQG